MIDVATVPPLHYGTTKRGSLYANDDKILEVTANKWVRNLNLTNFRNVNTQAGAITVMDADSTEQQSVTQEDEALATLPSMGKELDFTRARATAVVKADCTGSSPLPYSGYNREHFRTKEKQAMTATARAQVCDSQSMDGQSVANTDKQTSQALLYLN